MTTRIRELRVRNDIKQSDLAKDLGVSQSTLSNWERGEFEPDKDSLLKLAEIFNSTTDFILGRTDQYVSYNASNIRDSQFIQGSGSISLNGERRLSPEETELLRIYASIGVKPRHKLLECAFALEEESKNNRND